MSSPEFETVADWVARARLFNDREPHEKFAKSTIVELGQEFDVGSPRQHHVMWEALTDAARDYDELEGIRSFHEMAREARLLASKVGPLAGKLARLLDHESHNDELKRLEGLISTHSLSVLEGCETKDNATAAAVRWETRRDPISELRQTLALVSAALAKPHIPSPEGKPIEDYAMAIFVRRVCALCENGLDWDVTIDTNLKVVKSKASRFVYRCATMVGSTTEQYVVGQIRKYRTDASR